MRFVRLNEIILFIIFLQQKESLARERIKEGETKGAKRIAKAYGNVEEDDLEDQSMDDGDDGDDYDDMESSVPHDTGIIRVPFGTSPEVVC